MATITNIINTNNKEIDVQSSGGALNIATAAVATNLVVGNTSGSSSVTLNVGSGGLVIPSFTNYGVVGVSSAGLLSDIAAGSAGTVLTSNGSGSLPTWQAPTPGSGIVTIDGDAGSATGPTVTISGGSTGLTTSASTATINLTVILLPGYGGTGQSSLTSGSLLIGNGTSAVNFISYSAASGSSSDVVSRDANGNSWINNLTEDLTSNTASGTITLTAASGKYQLFSGGSGTATIVLPDATTLNDGWLVEINNNASGILTIQDNSLATLLTMPAGSYVRILLLTNSIAAGTWDYHWSMPKSARYSTTGLAVIGTVFGTSITATTGGLTATAGGLTVTAGTITTPFTTTGALVSNTSGVITDANASTSGYVLTSNGASTVPSFQALSASIGTINGDTGSMTGSTVTISGGTTGLTTSATSATMTISGTLVVANGGTGVTSVTVTPTATKFAGWDANLNMSANNFIPSLTAISATGGTTTLTAASSYIQNFTGAGNQTVQLPAVSTLQLGQQFLFMNTVGTTSALTINSSGGNTITVATFPNSPVLVTCISLTGTGVSSWSVGGLMYRDNLNNVVIGNSSGKNISSASSCVLLGQNAGLGLTTGTVNVFIGQNAGQTITTGANCTIIGNGAGNNAASNAAQIVVIGYNAAQNVTASTGTIAIGTQALQVNTATTANIAIGQNALVASTTGIYNTALGYNAGSNLTGSESSNIYIGWNASGILGESNALQIGAGTGTGIGQLSTARICGISGITLAATTSNVVMVSSGDQLTTQASTINFATAASQSIITIGNNTSASSVTITAGTGKVTINSPTATILSSGIATAPVNSSTATTAFGTSLTAGTGLQNTTGYNILVNICVSVTSATTATITLGVGPTSTPTAATVVASFSSAGSVQNFSAIVPNNYYVLVNTTGTITVGSITTQVCPL